MPSEDKGGQNRRIACSRQWCQDNVRTTGGFTPNPVICNHTLLGVGFDTSAKFEKGRIARNHCCTAIFQTIATPALFAIDRFCIHCRARARYISNLHLIFQITLSPIQPSSSAMGNCRHIPIQVKEKVVTMSYSWRTVITHNLQCSHNTARSGFRLAAMTGSVV